MVKNTETKKEIREKYRKIRKGLPLDVRRKADISIAQRLLEEPVYLRARFIYCYASVNDETGTERIIEESLLRGKKVALPRVRGKRRMEFCFIKSLADLRPGFMGIKEPGPWCRKAPVPSEHTLFLMPGIAFDSSGGRVGYGGGYYDAYLQGNTLCTKAALAYSVQIAPAIPLCPEDIKTDMIVTEEGLIICSQDSREIR